MPDIMETLKSPGIWIALVACVITMAAGSIAQTVCPNDEDRQLRIKLVLKTGGLVLAIAGFVIVVKKAFFS